ncbi:hypothetical protein EDF63_1855 [Curtobacterium sp. JUb34]|uniref:hypothetical protein n=1 Tax=Curtobacterium sp. JUb34 TaxID=2485109 RepID=UPI000FC13172|nr:hypothetical protein [Curtobacterium sp. JUb34]ROR33441.1 hypothetical protein EDF63_1855 [Curtobacterium sp. JUb34]
MTTHTTRAQRARPDDDPRALVLPRSAAFRWSAIITTAFVGLTAVAGGIALVVGVDAELFAPATSVLADTVFRSFVVPGLLLAVIVGGTHLLAAILAVRRSRWTVLAVAAAAFVLLVWIFVETAMIPWSLLQAVYFAVGLLEVGVVLTGLGLLSDGGRR